MSRHSHWAKIKHDKGATDKKKGALFSKLIKTVQFAAREGDDPGSNFKLRLAIDQAKAAGMTKDTMDRAVARGSGKDKDASELFEETYEGFAPGGAAIMIDVVTDNKNRAYQSLKQLFNKLGGNLGGSGSVAWQFQKKGVARLSSEVIKNFNSEELELKLIDAGADDIISEEGGLIVYTKAEGLKSFEEKIRAQGLLPEYAGLEWVPKERVSISDEVKDQLEAFQEALDEIEDVSDYFTNAA